MSQKNHEEAISKLRNLGFSVKDIDRLQKLRSFYAKQHEMDQACLDIRHLQFVRWLVRTGKLTDQIA